MLRPSFIAALLIAAIPALAIAPSAFAASKPITIGKAIFKDETSRLCMPRETLGPKVDKTLPKTICDTQAGWEARGVEFKIK